MKQIANKIIVLIIILIHVRCTDSVTPPAPVGPVPSEDQLNWQEMEFYGFLHFNMNTFTNIEWGYGDKSPTLFNPVELDTKQWAKVAKEAGMTGLIITAKHHDGFCLWPSKYTEYSVKNSNWKNGGGDVIRELSEACKEYGLKLGIYLSPWDRNHPDYGKPEYVAYFRNQLTELLTDYGDVFEVWFDGANGGDGYYGGANETRKVDKLTYYDWENTYKLIKELQPNAVIFSDAGPGVRWVGNEHGFSYETTWSTLMRDSIYGGMPEYSKKYSKGQENGTHWVPAEADVSIRPGWYYHKSEDDKVKSLEQLLDIYYKSVGRNSTFLLNFPVDDRGLIHENDIRQLKKLTAQLKEDFAFNLTINKKAEASNTRGASYLYSAGKAVDGNKDTYWATDDDVTSAWITIDLEKPTEFNRVLIQEYIRLGQRVKKFKVEAEVEGKWQIIDEQTTIGYKRILRLENIVASKVRINISASKACPLISNIEIYNAPIVVDAPLIERSKEGMVRLVVPEKGVDVFYTVDGEAPGQNSTLYKGEFLIDRPTIVKAYSVDTKTSRESDIQIESFDISKKSWKVLEAKDEEDARKAIDDNSRTNYTTNQEKDSPSIIVDLDKIEQIKGFTYTPTQARYASNVITNYSFYGSVNSRDWILLSKGEFSNIMANPIQQKTMFERPVAIKYFKLIANNISNNQKQVTFAEVGIVTNN